MSSWVQLMHASPSMWGAACVGHADLQEALHLSFAQLGPVNVCKHEIVVLACPGHADLQECS